MDLACGQFGDLFKYFNKDNISSEVSFIYAVDLVENNLTNRNGGALQRYIT